VNYFKGVEKFSIGYLFFYFGDIRVTVDVLLTITFPLILLTFLFPSQGLVLLAFHYLHEVFLSERLLDHNPKIKGNITHYFAWGSYHLEHHRNPKSNYSAFVTIWDKVFKTQKNVR
jgi:sterol desaturase/sphingolipid hydroxylase (fatty acid hydroxylase superfamily)